MSEIKYKDLDSYLKSNTKNFVFLIYGNKFLLDRTYKKLSSFLNANDFNIEELDNSDNIYHIIENLNTYPLLAETRIIYLNSTDIFSTEYDLEKELKKAKETFTQDKQKGGRLFVSILAKLDITKETFSKKKDKLLNFEREDWLDLIFNFILKENILIPEKKDKGKVLESAILKGFVEKTNLIITEENIDKRKTLFKTIKEIGLVIDCSISEGLLAQDKKDQSLILEDITKEILSPYNITINKQAFDILLEQVGFNIENFVSELNKLISFIGEKKRIDYTDVQALIQKSKEDPMYELSGAIAQRNLEKALIYTNSLLNNKIFPLQILATISNQIIKSLMMRNFIDKVFKKEISKSITYNDFKDNILKLMLEYDEKNLRDSEGYQLKEKNDFKIFIAKGLNPYPVYLAFMNAKNYSYPELINFINYIHQTDVLLKSSRIDPQTILENLILKITEK